MKNRANKFKPKVVRLQLPNCPAVVFDPNSCEWLHEGSSKI